MNKFRATFFLLVFSAPSFVAAQQTYAFPARVEINGIGISTYNSDRPEKDAWNESYNESFHPIGWSADGKAAYLLWSETEFYALFGVEVYDAVADSLVGEWYLDLSETTDLHENQVPQFWKEHQDSIAPLLNRFKIIQERSAMYLPFPAQVDMLKLRVEYSNKASSVDNRFVESCSGYCISESETGTDTIPFHWDGFWDVGVAPEGCWFSPDGKYSLYVIVIETGGQHGDLPPRNLRYTFRKLALKNN